MNTKLGELIKTKMNEQNLTVVELTKRLNGQVSATTVRNLIKLRHFDRPYFSSVLPILKELNIKLEDL